MTGPLSPSRREPSNSTPSFLRVVIPLLRFRRSIVVITSGVFLLVVVRTIMAPRTHTASGSFVPATESSQASGLMSLASQFGISAGGAGATESPDFYGALLRSGRILGQVVDSVYTAPIHEGSGPFGKSTIRTAQLSSILVGAGVPELPRKAAAIGLLRQKVSVTVDQPTRMVLFSVTTTSPELSQQIAQRILAAVNEFNLESRRARAASEREFAEEGLRDRRKQLIEAEDRLVQFHLQNRASGRAVQLEEARLQREVDMRQSIVTSLEQSYEQSRIAEVRKTPAVMVVDMPQLPARPDGRKLALKGILGLLVGLALSIFYAFVREALLQTKVNDPHDWAEFHELRRATIGDVTGPLGRVSSIGRRPSSSTRT